MPPRPETCFSGSTIGHISTNQNAVDWYDYGGASKYVPQLIYQTSGTSKQFTMFFLDTPVQ
jgi:hypothetical protein